MAVYFFDSSAVAKRYLIETGTRWVNSIADLETGNIVYLARITFVEVISAITRKAQGPGLSSAGAAKAIEDFRHDFSNEYSLIELTPRLVEWAGDLAEDHALRAYDAIQLAAALEINSEMKSAGAAAITMISADGALNDGAIAEGIAVDDPNSHL